MKRLTKLLALILAAAMALTALCVTASAEDTEKGYWKLNKTWVYMKCGPYDWKVTKDSGKYADSSDWCIYHTTFKEKADGTGAVITTTESNTDIYPNGAGSSTLTIEYSYPKSVYMSGETAEIKMSAAAVGTGKPYATLSDAYAHLRETKVEKDGTGSNPTESSFVDDDTKYSSYYWVHAYVDAKEDDAPELDLKCKIPEHSEYYVQRSGDYFTIDIYAGYAKVYYEYKWTKGTPTADDGNDYIMITLKKGASTQLGVNTKSKVTYSTSKKAVAAVTSSGKVTAKAKGTAVITMKYGSKTQKVMIKVTA